MINFIVFAILSYMESRDIFDNLSPIDHRYSLSESSVFKGLVRYLSESASIMSCAKAEVALIKAHLIEKGRLTCTDEKLLDNIADTISPKDVYEEEQKTRHQIRALVNVIKERVPESMSPLVHLGATSADILDTSLAMRMRDATKHVVLPELKGLETELCKIVEREAKTPQVGRTHGQHAVPITFGWALAGFVSRLGKSIKRIAELSSQLTGKLSGPVGAYNALCMIVHNPEEFEKTYLALLGLEPSEYSNQLVEPEYLLRLLLEMNVAFGVIAGLSDDLRNLQRSEIAEVFESFSDDQVGSSAMPQKRNPWNSEHVKSLWKAFSPRVITFYMDQISEHQRDLTNSASQRFISDYVSGFTMAVARMRDVVSGLRADRQAMKRNLCGSGSRGDGGILAEPAYILLCASGESDGHEIIRKITLECDQNGISFFDALKKHPKEYDAITSRLCEIGIEDTQSFFENPSHYCGLAAEKSKRIAEKYRKLME